MYNILVGFILLISAVSIFKFVENHVAADSPKIVSGVTDYCLNDRDNNTATNATVDAWKCNNTAAQVWAINASTITHDNKYCLAVQNNSAVQNTKVVLSNCNGDAGQVWLRDQGGFQNPNSNMCLSASNTKPESQLFIDSCSNLSNAREIWSPRTLSNTSIDANPTCAGLEGDKVACYAIKEWTTWQSGSPSHDALLTNYTDGAPYEEWCADFVSYVYKEAGHPFTQGESDGWDENIAGNIQNMGFTMHSASSGYIPKTGDVAYFNYEDGHVEIVVSGGKTPTFIYGDSATIDPSTGNGQMMANTMTSDGSEGQLVYYLSPN
jgi:hypothetical protein